MRRWKGKSRRGRTRKKIGGNDMKGRLRKERRETKERKIKWRDENGERKREKEESESKHLFGHK